MRVVVFGATGKTGMAVTRHALAAGHEVTVFGRSVERRFEGEEVKKVAGDVLDYEAVGRAVADQEAALVCLGPVGTKDQTTLSQGADNIQRAMNAHGVRRVIFVSAAGVGESWKHIPWYSKLLFSTMLKTVLAEHGREEAVFNAPHLDWTAVRAAVLTNKEGTGKIRADNNAATKTIPREDLAKFLVEQLQNNAFLNQAICVTSG